MEEDLPFELRKYHKTHTKINWKRYGLKENSKKKPKKKSSK